MSERTIVKKTAHVAIGLPVHTAGSVRKKMNTTKTRFERWRERMANGAEQTLQEWMKEGEHVVDSLATRMRSRVSAIEDTVLDGSTTARDVGRGIHAIATEPIVSLESIDGVGPTYAEKLANAGVISTRALVERCDSEGAVERLATHADVPAALIATWRDSADLSRINGIGPEHMALLNAAGVGTIEQVADLDPAQLHTRLRAVNSQLEVAGAVPGEPTVSDWIDQASGLVN